MEKTTILLLALFGFLALVVSGPTKLANPFAAEPCNVDACVLPDCHCSSQNPPGKMDCFL